MMTQLLLFESANSNVTPGITGDQTTSDLPASAKRADSTGPKTQSESIQNAKPDGVKHMGDLARAVLMRYEIMARRREFIQQRTAAKEAKQSQRTCELAKTK